MVEEVCTSMWDVYLYEQRGMFCLACVMTGPVFPPICEPCSLDTTASIRVGWRARSSTHASVSVVLPPILLKNARPQGTFYFQCFVYWLNGDEGLSGEDYEPTRQPRVVSKGIACMFTFSCGCWLLAGYLSLFTSGTKHSVRTLILLLLGKYCL